MINDIRNKNTETEQDALQHLLTTHYLILKVEILRMAKSLT